MIAYPIIILVLVVVIAALVIKSVKQQEIIKGYQTLAPYPDLLQELDLVGAVKGKLKNILSEQPDLSGLINYSCSYEYNDVEMYPAKAEVARNAHRLLMKQVEGVIGYLGDIEKLSGVKKYSPEN